MGRAPCCDKANVKRGPWSPEEDAALKNYVHSHGTGGNWIALPAKAGLKRCGKSCRLRWLNYLRPDIKHGSFTPQEDSIICSYYNQIGSRWSIIASQLPGRTDNDVKNYWNTKLKKKLLAGKVTAINNSSSSSTTSSSSATSYTCVPKKEPSMVSATDQSSTTTCYGLQDYTMYSPLLPSHNLHDQYAANSMEGSSISSDSSSILPNQLCGDDQDLGFGFGGFLPNNYDYNIWYPNMDGADFSLANYVHIKPQGLLNRSSHHQLTNQY